MKYYIEITILPNIEISSNFLWTQLFQKLHLTFVQIKRFTNEVPIGIGFPNYPKKHPLKDKLRLFARSKEDIINLNIGQIFFGLKDYIHIEDIKRVPENTKSFSCYKRQHIKKKHNLVTRKSRRHNINYEQALEDYKNFTEKHIETPFIHINSQSTKNRFSLFIQKIERDSEKYEGFNTYGLSKVSTVPEF
jgi:CRISPR-associated endonuclease Csy4